MVTWRDIARRYAIALTFTGVAAILISRPFIQSSPLLLLLGAVVLSAQYAGFGPALFSSALSVVIVFSLLAYRIPPDESALSRVLVFTAVSLVTAHMAKRVFKDQRRLQDKEQELAAAYEHLRLAQQAGRVGTWDWDPANAKLTWSTELERIHGLAPNTFGRRFEDWMNAIHPEDRQEVERQVRSAILEGRSCDVAYRTLHPDGSVGWIAVRAAPYSHKPEELPKLAGICMDVTERKLAEESLHRSEKLAATGHLAASIAHEINNPLESVINLVFLALNDPALSADTRRYLGLVDKELVRMAHIAKQTLGFYRGSSFPVVVRLGEVLDQMLELYSRKLEAKEVVLGREYNGNSEIIAFESELRQLFSNLIVNAIDALPAQGRLRVRITRSHLPPGPGVRVTIADNGRGIPPGQLLRIFDPFYTTKKEGGTGLGLWISHAIVEKHGGHLRVRSSVRPGHCGTVFTVFLPQSIGLDRLSAA